MRKGEREGGGKRVCAREGGESEKEENRKERRGERERERE